jgi:hypothetical protein
MIDLGTLGGPRAALRDDGWGRDVNWMQAIDPSVGGLCAERTSLSLGDHECRFAVLETHDPLARYTDTLKQSVKGPG